MYSYRYIYKLITSSAGKKKIILHFLKAAANCLRFCRESRSSEAPKLCNATPASKYEAGETQLVHKQTIVYTTVNTTVLQDICLHTPGLMY